MSYRIRAGLVALGIGSAFALSFSACGGLDSKQVIVHPDGTGETSGGGDAGTGASNSGGGDAGSGAANSNGGKSGGSVGGNSGSGETGGDGGSAGETMLPPPVPGVPSVISVVPGDKATGVDPAKVITLTFSEALAPTSVSVTSVQLKDSLGAVVPSAVTYAASVVTVTPAARLHLLESYTVNVSTAVTGTDSTPMAAPFTSSFSVPDGVWGKVEGALTTSTAAFDGSSQIQVASDGGSHAIAVWAQEATTTSTTYNIYASLYSESAGWAAPVQVNLSALSARYPYVAMNTSGNAIVSWQEDAGSNQYSLQTRRYYGGAWDAAATRVDLTSAQPVTTSPIYLEGYAVAMSPSGDAHVAWSSWYYDGTKFDYYGVYVRHVTPAGVWDASATTLQYSSQGYGVSNPSLGFDAAGNGFCAFETENAATPAKVSLVVERYIASSNKWGASTVASTASDGNPEAVGVGVSPDGQAAITWLRETGGTVTDVMGSYYNKAWTAPSVISNVTTEVDINDERPVGLVAWTGDSFWVTWAQTSGTTYNVYANEYKTAWGTPQILSDGNHNAVYPFIAGDLHGNALLMWAQPSDTAATATIIPYDITYSRLTGTDKWSDPKFAASTLGGYHSPQVAFLADGSAVAAWQRIARTASPRINPTNGEFQNTFR